MSFPRLPRFKRSLPKKAFRLTERDRRLLYLFKTHRFLRSKHISELLGEASPNLLRRLQLLFHGGFLERPRAQLEYYHQGGSAPIVYGLGNKGASLLRKSGALGGLYSWGEKNRGVGRRFLQHALLISDILVDLQRACTRRGIRFLTEAELLQNSTRPARLFRWKVALRSGLKIGCIPDRTFGLEWTTVGGSRENRYFFLEADRGTMPVKRARLGQTSFFRKLLVYEATWNQEVHTKRFGFARFRVLTITKHPRRCQSLVGTCSDLRSAQGLFLFADVSILDPSVDILSAAWRSGTGEIANLLD